MSQPHSQIESTAVWFVLDAREQGMLLQEIVSEVSRAYQQKGILPYPPDVLTPDDVTLWLADCWSAFGYHLAESASEEAA